MVALVTGASDGIGKACAKRLARLGYRVCGISRTPAEFSYMRHITADVSDRKGLQKAVKAVYEAEGAVDLLVACAGTSLASPAEMTDPRDARYLMDVNFFGYVDTVAPVLAQMKRRGRGKIILVSSMTGLLPIPYLSYYSSSKAALIAFACALSAEARPFGVSVCAVLPGGVRTQFTDKRKKYCALAGNPYAPGLKKAIDALGREEQTGLYPGQVADKIVRLATRRSPPVIVPVGGVYRMYALAQRFLPCRAVLFFLRKKYA